MTNELIKQIGALIALFTVGVLWCRYFGDITKSSKIDSSLKRGIQQAKDRKFAKHPPDLTRTTKSLSERYGSALKRLAEEEQKEKDARNNDRDM